MRRIVFHVLILACLVVLLGLAAIGPIKAPQRIERVANRGELVVGMRPGASTYYAQRDGDYGGFEYDLVAGFTKRVGLALRVVTSDDISELERRLDRGELDLVAAGIGPTPERTGEFAFTRPFLWVQPQVVRRKDSPALSSLTDLAGNDVELIKGTIHEARLKAAQEQIPGLRFTALEASRSEALLYRVWRGRTDYAVTDSNKLSLNKYFYPELRVALELGSQRPLAWMLRKQDKRLRRAIDTYIARLERSGQLAALIETHYGHLSELDYVGTRRFTRHTTERLPALRGAFQKAGEANDLDWRLLAAMGYQESLWESDAVSPTGVRGIMMLTRSTAAQVGVEDRTDPHQSIRGGGRYLASLYARLPKDITGPDRRWFALAAYNVGLGHVLDARQLTRMQGGAPSQWRAVRQRLPLLTKEAWYSQVKYGYARGWEPVRYVENVRRYYRLLRRITEPGLMATDQNQRDPAQSPQTIDPALQSAL